MRHFIYALLCFFIASSAQASFPGARWERLDALMQRGWDTNQLQHLRDQLDEMPTTVFLLIEDGKVVFEYGDLRKKLPTQQINLAALSALYGAYALQKPLPLTQTLADFSIAAAPPLSEEEKEISLEDLLKSRHPAYRKTALAEQMEDTTPVAYRGIVWRYNQWGFNVLATVYEQLTKQNVYHAFEEQVAKPIAMRDFKGFRHGMDVFFYPSLQRAPIFRMSARDLARLGHLFLSNGRWEDRQILDANWINRSLEMHSSGVHDMQDGSPAGAFGWLWWLAANGEHFPNVTLPPGSYSARGDGGQYMVIIPERRWVVVHLNDASKDEDHVLPSDFGRLLSHVMQAKQPI